MEQAETIYYQGRYWNDIPLVAREINRRFTGSPDTDWPDTDWIAHFSNLTNRVFKKALVINCGNGWVERDRVAAEVLAADFSYLQREPQSSMFDYIVASPKGEMTGSRDSEEADERSEIKRELRATRNGGYYRSPAWPNGHEIDFRLGSCGGRIFCEGLSFAEPHGSWTDGVASRIRFSGPINRGFRIDFDVAPFLGWNVDHSAQRTVESGNGQRVIVLLNGRHLSSTTVLKAGVLSIVVPEPRLDPTGEYEMNLVLPDAKQCIDSAGKVVDGRHLGILLTRATLVEL